MRSGRDRLRVAGYGNGAMRYPEIRTASIDGCRGGVIAFASPPPSLLESHVPKITLSARERDLVSLLAQGHTDLSAAAILHISPRSVTNILRNLMDRLGVENRFQLGLALGFLRKANVPTATAGKDL
jgi:DNA-binding CsgD family transcriptional regulator